jgi:hypothetical protein
LKERGESFYQDRMKTVVQLLEKEGVLVDDVNENGQSRKIMWTPDIKVTSMSFYPNFILILSRFYLEFI